MHAAAFRGVVTYVTDGDSLWIRPTGEKRSVEVRLLHLDAPEACQPHGPEAEAALRGRVLREPVMVHAEGTDGYQRTLARIEWRGQDVGAWLVRNGHAWSTGFRRQPGRYAALQWEARRERRGLWAAGAAARPPREFRRRHGRCE